MKISKAKSNKNIKSQLVTNFVKLIVEEIQGRKGENIVCLDLTKINNTFCDYFIICHGNSNVHVESIADAVEEQIRKKTGEKPWHIEGKENADWILLDYINVVVHVFQREPRRFYQLEDLWADAEIIEIDSNLQWKLEIKN